MRKPCGKLRKVFSVATSGDNKMRRGAQCG
jgi:hypothetical protein